MIRPDAPVHRPFDVTAALIVDRRRLLIARRAPSFRHGLQWEFPGGKREDGESLEECLVREIREELSIAIRVRELFMTVRHSYSDYTIDLHAFWCSHEGGELTLRDHSAVRWVQPAQLDDFQFCEADRKLIASLRKNPPF